MSVSPDEQTKAQVEGMALASSQSRFSQDSLARFSGLYITGIS